MWDSVAQVLVLVALIGVISALSVALLSKRHQREQQQRDSLLKPSEYFARKAIEALAALRYTTRLPWTGSRTRYTGMNRS